MTQPYSPTVRTHADLIDQQMPTPTRVAFLYARPGGPDFTAGVQETLDRTGVPWSVSRLGAQAEYRFASPAPRTGSESAAAADDALDEYLHLFMANRGVLITPFHNMALMSPVTTDADVDRHTEVFAEAVDALVS